MCDCAAAAQTPFVSMGNKKKRKKQENECVFPTAVYQHTVQAQDGPGEAGLGSMSGKLQEKHGKKVV